MKIRTARRFGLSQKGFTLIEIVIGLVIFAVGLLGVAAMQITSVRGNSFSIHLSQASYLAHERLEYLRGLSSSDSALSPGNHSEGTFQYPGNDTVFNRSYKVTPETNLLKIEYQVTWYDGANHSVTFRTKVAK